MFLYTLRVILEIFRKIKNFNTGPWNPQCIGVHTHPVNLQKHNKLDPGAGHTQLPISLRLSSFAPFLIWFISIFYP